MARLVLLFAILTGAGWLAGCGARTGLLEAAGPDADALATESDAAAAADTAPPAPPPCVPGAPPRVIATLGTPYAPVLAIDDRTVYFVAGEGDAGAFASVSKDGGPVTMLAPAPPPNVEQLLVDDENLYALDYRQGVFRIPKQGGPSVQLTPDFQLGGAGMALDDTFVYYSDGVDAWKVPKQGGPPTLLAGQTGTVPQNDWIFNLRLVEGSLFWTQPDSGFYTCAKDGSNPHLIATLDAYGEACEFVTDGTTAYAWIEPLGPAAELVSLPVAAGGPIAPIVSATGYRGLWEDDALLTPSAVYWTGSAGTVGPADGGDATQGILALSRGTGAVTLVAATGTAVVEQDGVCLYWLDGADLYTVAE
jgi:hypothetical protein